MKKSLAFVFAFAATFTALTLEITVGPPVVFAQSEKTTRTELKWFLGSSSTTVKGNAAESARTFSVELDRTAITASGQSFPMLNLFFALTAHAAATHITMACYASNDGGTTLFQAQSIDVSTGVGTSNDASFSKAVSGTKNWVWRVNTTAFPGTMKCIVGFTAGAVGDELKVSGTLSTR